MSPGWLIASLPLFVASISHAASTLSEVVASRDLRDLSLEQLSEVVVSSVSGHDEQLSGALASVYVISADDIRRAGVTSLMEALRLAPNLEVARGGALGYAISARGFIGELANKLLVLVDGRTIYTPTFSGVFWEANDTLLSDIERIEVISGPGGVLWGANAVNGVINVITRSAADTQGTQAAVGWGSGESGAYARHADAWDAGHFRVYAKRWRWDSTQRPGGSDRADGWDRQQAGFRTDWSAAGAALTLEGDVYQADRVGGAGQPGLNGAHLLTRWRRQSDSGDAWRVQAYVERTSRPQQHLDTVDLDLQQAMAPRGVHRLTWGGGLRHARDRIENSAALALLPAEKHLTHWNVYALDEIALGPDLDLSAGAKIDRNPYTGPEFLPSMRLGWRPVEGHLLWGGASRAVRTPSRFDRELYLPGLPPYALAGGPDFRSEISRVYEIGYRGQLGPAASLSVTTFVHELDWVRTVMPVGSVAQVGNGREGRTRGWEAWGSLAVTTAWRLHAGYSRLDTQLVLKPGQVDLQPPGNFGTDPRSWWTLRSQFELEGGWELDLLTRRQGASVNGAVPAYTATDLRLGWRSATVELGLRVQNLADPRHVEWTPSAAEFRRGAQVEAVFRFP